MTELRLYRGIAVEHHEADETINRIRRDGLLPGEGRWTMLAPSLKPRLAELWQLPEGIDKVINASGDEDTWICAADEVGATYYAGTHNRSARDDTPLLITLEVNIADVIVDGRDFLFSLFQLGEPARARPVAKRLFGPGVLRYVDRAWSTADQSLRVALCKLAVQDDAVITAHAANTTLIIGRHNTHFCSAFLVRAPVTPDRIKDVQILEESIQPPDAAIKLDDVR